MSTYSVPPTASGDRAGSAGTTRALWVLIAVSTLLRLVWAGCLGAVVDEPYYIQYILHPDWSYFDHPPMVALVGMPGLALAGDAYSLLGLRVGFIVLFAGSTWLLARLTTGFYGPRAGLFAALALNVSGYFGMAVGTIAFPDGPLLFFWLLTLDRLAVALDDPRRLSPWVGMGIAWGGAMLSKYHAVLLPVGAVLYLILQPRARRCLRVPGSYLAVMIGLVMFAPVVYWNASHGWASLLFQGGRASASRGFRPEQLAVAIGAESLYLFPWLWIALVGILVQLVRRGWRRWDDGETFLVCQAVPALGLFHAVASFDRIMPYWPLFGFVSLLPLLCRSWVEWLDARPVLARRCLATVAVIPVLLAALICTQATFGLFGDSRGRLLGLIPPEGDPTVGLIGWDQLAAELEQRGLLGDPKTFLFTDSWHRSAPACPGDSRQGPGGLLRACSSELQFLEPSRGLGGPRRHLRRSRPAPRPARALLPVLPELRSTRPRARRPPRCGRPRVPTLSRHLPDLAVPLRRPPSGAGCRAVGQGGGFDPDTMTRASRRGVRSSILKSENTRPHSSARGEPWAKLPPARPRRSQVKSTRCTPFICEAVRLDRRPLTSSTRTHRVRTRIASNPCTRSTSDSKTSGACRP